MKSIALFFVCLALWSGASFAGELPRFDVEAHCQELASFGGSSNVMFNTCIEMEQQAYNGLKDRWAGLPAGIRNECTDLASFGGGDYSMLATCVKMETQAAANKKSFSFE